MRTTKAEQLRTHQQGAERLRKLAGEELQNRSLIVIANREPYAHEWGPDGGAVIRRPVSGLVTGIEPMLLACGGTWIAHGEGAADRAHADAEGRLAVPPDDPQYTLRRLWIEKEEYERYYSGFANEGLWPLCHIAYTQPVFRSADWQAYRSVNEAFARAAAHEVPADGLILIQDYHFALVPRMIRDSAPHAATSIFWHIPWPNWELFGICPWKEDLLDGMLGADIIGFQTRQHCLNFLEAAQRYLGCRTDAQAMTIAYRGHVTRLRSYPISVEWPYPAATRIEGRHLRNTLGISHDVHVSIGVDRADYTKGLIERVAAVELLLEENPSLAGRYMLVQLASPTRTGIGSYRQLAGHLHRAVDRVNERFGTESWTPIVLQMRSFSPEEVRQYYAMADSALVTPLHDGMNLVAKEYVAACEDGDGVLVLSRFAGAANELDEALQVNPYDTQQVARSILQAIRMPSAERRSRIEAMRRSIAASSIYDWSEKLLTDLCEARVRKTRMWPHRMHVEGERREAVR
jgi:trehalose 6-phosphate synthase